MLGKLAKQSATYGISTILGRLLSYLLTPYYTRLFAPEEYGIITDLYALIPFALVILTMGMESSYFRFAARAENEGVDKEDIQRRKNTLFATTWGITILLSILFCIAVIVCQSPISEVMGAAYVAQPELVTLVALLILFDVVACVPFAKLRERGEAHKYVMLKLMNIILQVGLAVAFGFAGLFSSQMGVEWVIIANLIASIITLFVTIRVAGFVFPRINPTLLCAVMIYSFPLLLSGIAGTATDFLDRQMIKYIIPDGAMAQLGLYGAVTKIAVVMTLFTQMYRLAAEPFFLSNFKKEEFVESNAAAMKFYIIATVAIFLGITLFKDLFAYIVGSDFREGIYILPVILGSNLLMGVWLNLSFWYKREESTKYALYITLLGLVASIISNLILIPISGYGGAAWSRLISEGVMVLFSYYLLCKHYPIPYDLGRIAQYILLGGALFGISVVVGKQTDNFWVVNGVAIVLLMTYSCFAVWREKIDIRGLVSRIIR
ncbi:MAG: oligosaccharide flippase family protein [Rikenellaceae bacterium]